MQTTETLFRVSMCNKRNVDEATRKLTGVLIGPDCEYEWYGSGPEYDDNGKLITRVR